MHVGLGAGALNVFMHARYEVYHGLYSGAFGVQKHPPPTLIISKCLIKGELSPNLLSEMSLPGVEVFLEKLLPKILGRLGKENPSKRRCNVASVSVQFLYRIFPIRSRPFYKENSFEKLGVDL